MRIAYLILFTIFQFLTLFTSTQSLSLDSFFSFFLSEKSQLSVSTESRRLASLNPKKRNQDVWARFNFVRKRKGWGSDGATPFQRITSGSFPGLNIPSNALFGNAVINLGDIDGNGYDDIAVGAPGESVWHDGNGTEDSIQERVQAGGVYIFLMKEEGQILNFVHINGTTDQVRPLLLFNNDQFGFSLATIGDLDGDGVTELAVGAPGYTISTVYILFLRSNGSVKTWNRIRGNYIIPPLPDATYSPTLAPTALPTIYRVPTRPPVSRPTLSPLIDPLAPTSTPTSYPTSQPSVPPTSQPTIYSTQSNDDEIINTDDDDREGEFYLAKNGPPIFFGSRLGASLYSIGDFNGDGIPDLAVGQVPISGSRGRIHFLYLSSTGKVLYYDTIDSSGFTIYDFTKQSDFNFGASFTLIGDINNDTISDLLISSPLTTEASSLNIEAGAYHICLLNYTIDTSEENFIKKNYYCSEKFSITETSSKDLYGQKGRIPSVSFDHCGLAMTTLGDLNRDDMNQNHPLKISPIKPRPFSIPDLIIGCPQGTTPMNDPSAIYGPGSDYSATRSVYQNDTTGRLFIFFLDSQGRIQDRTLIPSIEDSIELNFPLPFHAQLGRSLSSFQDIDKNGISELLVGAPGDWSDLVNSYDTVYKIENEENQVKISNKSGSVFLFYLRRKRYHQENFDYVLFYILTVFLPLLFVLFIVLSIAYFCYYFRRQPDQIEIIVKKSGYEYDFYKPRHIPQRNKPGQVYCIEYTV